MSKTSLYKRFFTACILAALCWDATSAAAADFESAQDAVKNMGVGWCLGNALDANSQTVHNTSLSTYWGQQDLSSQTCWGQSITKPELIKMMKEAGFGAIRVPVTWYNHMDINGNVNSEWMARVHEIVDYIINNGMYCIINVHHDTGADSDSFTSWIKADETNYTNNKTRYENLWKQIAEEFKEYDQHLLFEGYNEMLDTYSSWCYASFNTISKYNANAATSAYNAINSYAQSFVSTVRATGGNNAQRNLIVNTYGSCCGQGTWSSHLKEPLKNMKLPTDNASGHLAFQVHDYPNIEGNMTTVKSQVDDMFAALKTNLVSKGAPVIIGEWGTSNVDGSQTDYDLRRDKMFEFVDYFVGKAKENNMATFYWSGLSNGAYRDIPVFDQADLAECIVKAYRGSDFEGLFPSLDNVESITIFEGSNAMDWGKNTISISSTLFNESNKGKILEITYTQNYTDYDDIQFYFGDWSEVATVSVDGKSYKGDFGPYNHYKTGTGTTHTTSFTLSDDTFTKAAQKNGIVIQGHGVTTTKVALVNKSSTGITLPLAHDEAMQGTNAASNSFYELQGRKVTTPTHPGIYIVNGKKVAY